MEDCQAQANPPGFLTGQSMKKGINMDTKVSAQALRTFMERAYEKEGFEKEDAAQIADVLMQADLFGIESHGAQRMMYYHQNIK